MDRFLENLKHQAEENPAVALGLAAALLTALGKLVEANNNARNSKTWRREEKRREKKDRLRTR